MTKLNRTVSLALTALCALALSSTAQASPIFSGADRGICTLGAPLGGGACTTQEVEAHAAWQSNDPRGYGAAWVSYADTGIDGMTLAPGALSAENPFGMSIIMTVEETFEIGELGGYLDMMIWADDTARVFVDDFEWISPMWAQGTCAARAIGCQPDEYGELLLDVAAGLHTLRIEAFQVGSGITPSSNPFGVLYSGEAVSYVRGAGSAGDVPTDPSNPMPEPSAALVFGAGLVVVGLAGRREV